MSRNPIPSEKRRFPQLHCLGADFFLCLGDELGGCHGAGVAVLAASHRDSAALGFLIAHNEHIRHFFQLRLADLVSDLLAALVAFHAQPRIGKLLFDLLGVLEMTLGNREDLHLHGREPHRERAREMLCQDADEPLDAAEYHAVDHDRAVLLAVLAGIFELKPLRKLEVELDGAARKSIEARFQFRLKLQVQ